MTDQDYARALDELDRLLNDPDVDLEPARVWALLAEVSAVGKMAGRRAAA
jgi:hypothetical protein